MLCINFIKCLVFDVVHRVLAWTPSAESLHTAKLVLRMVSNQKALFPNNSVLLFSLPPPVSLSSSASNYYPPSKDGPSSHSVLGLCVYSTLCREGILVEVKFCFLKHDVCIPKKKKKKNIYCYFFFF